MIIQLYEGYTPVTTCYNYTWLRHLRTATSKFWSSGRGDCGGAPWGLWWTIPATRHGKDGSVVQWIAGKDGKLCDGRYPEKKMTHTTHKLRRVWFHHPTSSNTIDSSGFAQWFCKVRFQPPNIPQLFGGNFVQWCKSLPFQRLVMETKESMDHVSTALREPTLDTKHLGSRAMQGWGTLRMSILFRYGHFLWWLKNALIYWDFLNGFMTIYDTILVSLYIYIYVCDVYVMCIPSGNPTCSGCNGCNGKFTLVYVGFHCPCLIARGYTRRFVSMCWKQWTTRHSKFFACLC